VFDVYENDLNVIRKGDKITFTTPSLPNEIFKAQVAFVDPIINAQTRTVSVRAEIDNLKMKLKPEMFVQGNIRRSHEAVQLTVPKTAVLWTGVRSVVYIKLPNTEIPSFEFREIELDQMVGDQYVVLKGVTQGEEVVTNGAFIIDAAAQLNNRSSMMNRNISK